MLLRETGRLTSKAVPYTNSLDEVAEDEGPSTPLRLKGQAEPPGTQGDLSVTEHSVILANL